MNKNTLYKRRFIGSILAILVALTVAVPYSPVFAETPELSLTGSSNASTVLNNLNYQDVKASNTWAKEAIYESGALDMMKGYGSNTFGLKNTLTKEQAIALAYRLAGREADAQKAAETLDNARAAGDKKINPTSMWSDGYLQLAANEGLISQQDFNDAMAADQTSLDASSFHRGAPAQRQEMAFWIAKTLNLSPQYGQQKIFNNYKDWSKADPIKIPYIEAILQNNIMNGDGSGSFYPTQSITREQAAQIIKNASAVAYPLLKYTKLTGSIEDKANSSVASIGGNTGVSVINIRNSNGKLDQLTVQSAGGKSGINEETGQPVSGNEKEVVVYRNGQIGKSSLLKVGDKVEYIVASDNSVKFINVISANPGVKYITANIDSVDTTNGMISVTELYSSNYSDDSFSGTGPSVDKSVSGKTATFVYSNNVSVESGSGKQTITDVQPDTIAELKVQNGIVTAIRLSANNAINKETGVVNGIVEENNPQLGYITLFNEDGSGTSPEKQNQLILGRTYNYSTQGGLEVQKNQQPASIEDIETGDSVFLRTDEDGNIVSISAADNYITKYGKVISKRPSTLAVKFDDGSQQVLDVPASITVLSNNRLVGYNSLKDGDRVKLLLNEGTNITDLKEITIEGGEHLITNVYKGVVSYINNTSGNLVMQNLQVLNNGKWVKTDQKGFTNIKLSNECAIYLNDVKKDISSINSYARGNEAYIAVMKDYGGTENALMVSFRNTGDTETIYNDSVASAVPGSGSFSLNKQYQNISYGPGSIIIKDNRLVSGSSITDEDMAYVIANKRNYAGDNNYAGVVQIGQRSGSNFINIYRARIQSIDENESFTVESFSQLDGLTWDYQNTPKTFNIKNNTRILDDSGVVAQRDFTGYGDNSYVDKVVYILANDLDAVLISTAPFGNVNVKGDIADISTGSGSTAGSAGTNTGSVLTLRNSKVYDLNTNMWTASPDITVNVLQNSIVLKDNQIVDPSALVKGDSVRVIKKDNTATGDGYIIIVES
ncbi:MAG: S-layer homology domain-containing protein [Bacillota bacterium]|nr:S-layer homology domain-containing protein [Bacillota bacterium]